MASEYRFSNSRESSTSIQTVCSQSYPCGVTPKDVQAWVFAARAKKKWTQEQLGDLLGLFLRFAADRLARWVFENKQR